ncbi:DUF6875 domain-containing protein [Couchioplanes caeruleus]|uniref:DUF6875 domain-containing protein n=2 Tax=Couchioplanes caeruleus TaxID=56438 RepID=A0A1K0GWV7_9ACTN|nr:hypothetical protein [Couchioplanes caeruleus]OJF15884.1 hypothetical protein BG844_02145 [Couchioplanes caeruleus subsp. caeruleus]ROP28451.1 hypothetical protein EDD30_1214 [Couchioplanes caeruleus]
MLTHPDHPGTLLFEVADLAAAEPHPAAAGAVDQLRAVVHWAREYLCRPHPELGRRGPVCPYAQASLERGSFYLAVRRGTSIDAAALERLLVEYRDWFRRLEPVTGPGAQFKTILLVFPDLPVEAAATVVDATQQRLKPRYVADGLMIGEFHGGPPPKAGLWNADFRPLRSPLPLLAIRHMVVTDFPFLAGDRDLVAAYLRLFGEVVPAALRRRVAAEAARWGLPAPGVAIGDEPGRVAAPQPQGV